MRIKVVGPCASGKSVLAARLRELGYDASSAAQDHSYVPDMWQRLNPPDLLVYLDVTLDAQLARQRGDIGMGWDQDYLEEQHDRLRHARAHCHLYVLTDDLTEEMVLEQVLDFLGSAGPLLGPEREIPKPFRGEISKPFRGEIPKPFRGGFNS